MRWRSHCTLASLVVLVVFGCACLVAASEAQAAPVTSMPAAASTTVTLITGDQVTVTALPDGKPGISVRPLAGGSAAFATESVGGELYVIPSDAQPFLGRQLDASLFDVTALARAAGGRIPVVLSSDEPPPGVIMTDRTHGYVTPQSAPEFGAALHSGTALDGVTRIARDGAAPPVSVQPMFVMETLRIRTLGLAAQPVDIGTVVVLNTDDGRKYATTVPLATSRGELRISVPRGHYAISALFTDFSSGTFSERFAQVADVVVNKDTTVTLDERAANVPVSVDVPRPTQPGWLGVQYVRQDARDTFRVGAGVLASPASTVYVQPTPKRAKVGHLAFSVQTHRDSPATVAAPYSYDVKLISEQSVPAKQHYRVSASQLATIEARYYSDVPSWPVSPVRIAALDSDLVHTGLGTPVTAPGRRIEYVSAGPDITYFDSVKPAGSSAAMEDGGRQYRAGSVSTVDWMRGPRAPGFAAWTGRGPWECSACRIGDHISLQLSALLDSVPGHAMGPDLGHGRVWDARFRIAENGRVLLDWPGIIGIVLPASGASGDYALTYDQTAQGAWNSHSQTSHSEWTFHSTRPAATAVPSTWRCPDYPGYCAAVPLLVANYALPQGLDGTVAAGPAGMTVTFGHASGAPAVPITSAAVDVSFDGGLTWTPAGLADQGDGTYHASWANPAAGSLSVRVRAADADGATLSQSVLDVATIR